jgi:hypothetical protein
LPLRFLPAASAAATRASEVLAPTSAVRGPFHIHEVAAALLPVLRCPRWCWHPPPHSVRGTRSRPDAATKLAKFPLPFLKTTGSPEARPPPSPPQLPVITSSWHMACCAAATAIATQFLSPSQHNSSRHRRQPIAIDAATADDEITFAAWEDWPSTDVVAASSPRKTSTRVSLSYSS